MMTRSRITDHQSYDPAHDRAPSPWNNLDTATQRFVAWAGAIAVIITVCAWASQTINLNERVTKVETEQVEAKSIARDNLELARSNLTVMCILTRKVDPTIVPSECAGTRK